MEKQASLINLDSSYRMSCKQLDTLYARLQEAKQAVEQLEQLYEREAANNSKLAFDLSIAAKK